MMYLCFALIACPSVSANNYALKGKRKTLNAADVFAAMKDMEFEEFIEPLERSLQGKYMSGCSTLPMPRTSSLVSVSRDFVSFCSFVMLKLHGHVHPFMPRFMLDKYDFPLLTHDFICITYPHRPLGKST